MGRLPTARRRAPTNPLFHDGPWSTGRLECFSRAWGLQVGAQSALPKIITTGFRAIQVPPSLCSKRG